MSCFNKDGLVVAMSTALKLGCDRSQDRYNMITIHTSPRTSGIYKTQSRADGDDGIPHLKPSFKISWRTTLRGPS